VNFIADFLLSRSISGNLERVQWISPAGMGRVRGFLPLSNLQGASFGGLVLNANSGFTPLGLHFPILLIADIDMASQNVFPNTLEFQYYIGIKEY